MLVDSSPRVVCCLCSDGFLWWLNRSYLSPVLDHYCLGDDPIRIGRDHLHPGPLCNHFEAGRERAPTKEAWLLWLVQPRIRRRQPRVHVRRRIYHPAWRPSLCDLSGDCWSHGIPVYTPPQIVSTGGGSRDPICSGHNPTGNTPEIHAGRIGPDE